MTIHFPILFGVFLAVCYATAATVPETISNYDQLIRGVSDAQNEDNPAAATFTWNTNATEPMDSRRQMENRNKKVVLGFLNEFFGDKNIESSSKYISSKKYIQHNPYVKDGLDSVQISAKDWFKGAPKEKMDIRRISAEGDLVWAHLKTVGDEGKPVAVVDIFRLEDGLIVEHWDVIQPIPEKAANDHPMF